MITAIIVIVIVLAAIAAPLFSLLRARRLPMPSKEVLERAKQRAREWEAEERAEEKRGQD